MKGSSTVYDNVLLEQLPMAVYTCDADGRITFFNEYAATLWGRTPDTGKDLWCGSYKLYNSDNELLQRDEFPLAPILKAGKQPEEQEVTIERPDGSTIKVISHPKLLHDSNGNIAGAMNMLVDVTRQKQDEEKAARLSSIVQSSSAAIISKTLTGIVTSWNGAANRIFGYTPDEMIGQPIIKLIPHDLYHEEETILALLSRGESLDHLETKRIRKDGQLIDVSLTVSPVRDEKGKIIGVSKIARDITQLKNAARTIRESDERFRMAVEATRLGTWEYDPVTQDLNWSGECKRIYGFDDNEKIEYSVFLKHIFPDDYNYVTEHVEKALDPRGDGTYDLQFRIKRKDGIVRWIRSQGKVYFNEIGLSERFIGTVLDITEEKNAKEELERLVAERTRELKMMNKQLQRSNSDLAQFASVASHDLQEPLRKVHMYCDRILENRGNPDIYDKYFPKIMTSVARMSQLIKDVLHYAQISDGMDEVKEVNLNDVFENVISDLEVAIKEKDADIKASDLPVIAGNPIQLQQLFANLISNSIKFSERKPVIRIQSRALKNKEALHAYKSVAEKGAYVELKFEDNGIGFEQKFAHQVFEIFQRLQDRTVYSGTGIGLAICKKIVENHHGIIRAKSEPGAGTSFTIILPVK